MSSNSSSLDGANILVTGGTGSFGQAFISRLFAAHRPARVVVFSRDELLAFKDIATLQAEIAALRARQQAVEDLQADRNMPVHLLNELVRQTPDGVYLTGLKQDNQTISISGIAQSNERVSELLRNLSQRSTWLTQPQLVEILAASMTLSPLEQRRVFNFTLRATLSQGARPVPVPIRNSRSPPVRASRTRVPVGFLPIRTVSPATIFCRREVRGPSATLMEKNSSSSAQQGLAME
mgnify:CR=1 FL=1